MGSHLFYAKPWDTFALLCESFLLVRKQGEFAMMASDERKKKQKTNQNKVWLACILLLGFSMRVIWSLWIFFKKINQCTFWKSANIYPQTNTKKETRNINKKTGHRLRDPVTPNDPLGSSWPFSKFGCISYPLVHKRDERPDQQIGSRDEFGRYSIHQKAWFL